ncbi:hypothetical protein [Bradyrhizobium sp. dw_411]|uniref:hypothetical protein n=1 Tax=Bradyrhizobium sp. dw_411 TaxID=2720082 RepID=UPI001BCEC8A7|nr:hypothetical protein [Bradyrhizobium sp. dw_411]
MNISSISAPTPVNLPDPSASKPPAVQPDDNSNDVSAAQPQAQAPLPPGQGTRVNQLA